MVSCGAPLSHRVPTGSSGDSVAWGRGPRKGGGVGDLANLDVASYLALVVVLGAASQVVAWRLRVPSLLLLLPVGFVLGQFVVPDEVLGRDALFGGVSIAVGIILFEGALSLDLRELREIGGPVLRLCSITVVVAWGLLTLAGLAIRLSVGIAILAGAILVVTGPTVVSPILRILRPTKRVSLMLRWEAIVVDPLGAALAVLIAQALVTGRTQQPVIDLIGGVAMTALFAVVAAGPAAVLLEVLMRRHWVPDHLQGVAFLAGAVGTLMASNDLQPDSGLLAVTLLGIWLANRRQMHLQHVREFKEHLQVIFVGGLFVLLAGRISPTRLLDVLPQALVFVVLIVVAVRPLSVFIGLLGTNATGAERRLLSGMAPRGIVAAAVISTFALDFERVASERVQEAASATGTEAVALQAQADRLAQLATQANDLVPLIFLIIVATVAIYGLGVGRLARRLGLASANPQGVLFAGGSPWVVQAAQRLEEIGVTTLLVSREYGRLAGARRAGLSTVTANILSDYAVRDLDLSGIARLIACTADDEVNSTAAREFAQVLGRAKVFQIARKDSAEAERSSRRGTAAHLTAQVAFSPALTFEELDSRVEAGAVVKRTSLSEEYTLDDFHARYGEDAVVMFVVRGDRVEVVGEGTKLPQKDASLIALVQDPEPEVAPTG